jgi:hypothetical protein
MMASWTYWPDRATAWKARPTDGTKFSIVNAARKALDELAERLRTAQARTADNRRE